MKKLIAGLLTLVLMLSCGMTALAVEVTEDGGTQAIDVYAKAQYAVEGVYPAPVTDATAAVTTDEGITVSVTDAPKGSARLVVIPVSEAETEAWEWIADSLKTMATSVHAFNIYFEDAGGRRIDADGAAVTVNCPHCASVPAVCSLDTDGTAQVLTSSALRTAVSFTTNGSPYYILAEELPKQDAGIDDPTPDTGDNTNLWLWVALLCISGGGLFGTGIYKKKQKEN